MSAKTKSIEKTTKASDAPADEHAFRRHKTPAQPQNAVGFVGVQQTAGNLVVQSLLRTGAIQAKLRVSQPGDADEQEADRMAEQVVSSASAGVTQRKCAPCAEGATCPKCEEEEKIQTKEKSGHTPHVDSKAAPQITSLRGGGQPLPPSARAFFEPRFGQNFSQVRVHTDGQATESARAIQAKAFTVEQDVVFGAGEYTLESVEGKRLLAHELAHVVQQRRAISPGESNSSKLSPPLIQRQTTGFGPDYKNKKSYAQQSYDAYKSAIGANDKQPPLQAASKFGGTKISPLELTREELIAIMNPPGTGHDDKLDAILDKYLPAINGAFETMQLDTVESQAEYLAHAAGETGSFRKLEEKTIQAKSYKGFEGRGPIQVTGEPNYVQTLAYLERQADILSASPDVGDQERAKLAREAVNAIKQNPKAAADEKYTFLFSAAYMHMAGGVRRSAGLKGQTPTFPGDALEDSWVSGGKNNQAMLKAAQDRLAKVRATLEQVKATPDPNAQEQAAAEEQATAAVTKASNDVTEWQSTINRGAVKRDTYARAKAVLAKKAVPKPA